jgi:putative transposase
MARANRHHIPGQVWHITHRCHKKEFLLKFSKDRRCWHSWLFEAKKRFDLKILNYVITSNYIHLLVIDNGPDVIPKSLQLEICGFNEIQNPPERYGVIDMSSLRSLCGFPDPGQFSEQYRQWFQEAISNGNKQRESCWTESIAVGGIGFVEETKARLGIKGIGRRIEEQEADRFVLREEAEPYSAVFDPENRCLSLYNSYCWDVLYADSMR